jgi:hypothetical protein
MTVIAHREGSDTEHNLGLRHDELKPARDASVDQTNGT